MKRYSVNVSMAGHFEGDDDRSKAKDRMRQVLADLLGNVCVTLGEEEGESWSWSIEEFEVDE